ncbi:MAG: hypothetical protein Rubg2KO_22390 [Rubricoccaceae bacterium]
MLRLPLALVAVLCLVGCDSNDCGDLGCELVGTWTLVSIDGEPADGELTLGVENGWGSLPTGSRHVPQITSAFRAQAFTDDEQRRRLDFRDWGMDTSFGARLGLDLFGVVDVLDETRLDYVVLEANARLVVERGQGRFPFPAMPGGARLVFER